ncbi:hypothetical protein FRC18_007637, partial [Serendipita sp. 400]
MFSKLATLALALASFVPLAAAHGTMSAVVIDGKRYDGPLPAPDEPGKDFAIRQVNSVNPVKGTDNPDINCGHNAQKATLVADAAAGSTVQFIWRNGERGSWVHNTGPVMTYMAACGDQGCTTFDSANAQFFKISELGKKPEGGWYMADLTTSTDASLSVTLPENLPAGEYLLRHELIAMQLGMSPGGAEFYPACVQIRLSAPTRNGAALPSGNEVTTFPGAYKDTDPGIYTPNIYEPTLNYVFPGPPVVALAAADPSTDPSGSGSDTPTTPTNTESDGTPSSSSTEAPAPTGGSGCGGGSRSRKTKRRVVKRV